MTLTEHQRLLAGIASALWPLFLAASRMTDYHLLSEYVGLAVGFGVAAFLIIIFTRGRLGYQR